MHLHKRYDIYLHAEATDLLNNDSGDARTVQKSPRR